MGTSGGDSSPSSSASFAKSSRDAQFLAAGLCVFPFDSNNVNFFKEITNFSKIMLFRKFRNFSKIFEFTGVMYN